MFKIFRRIAEVVERKKEIEVPEHLKDNIITIASSVSVYPLKDASIYKPSNIPQEYWDHVLESMENAFRFKGICAGFTLEYNPKTKTCNIKYPQNAYDIPVPDKKA